MDDISYLYENMQLANYRKGTGESLISMIICMTVTGYLYNKTTYRILIGPL